VRALVGALAQRLDVPAIVTSDLKRATQTARLLGERFPRATLRLERGLREVDVGSWSGKTMSEIAAEDPATRRRWLSGNDVPRGGGETRQEVLQRATQALLATLRAARWSSSATATPERGDGVLDGPPRGSARRSTRAGAPRRDR